MRCYYSFSGVTIFYFILQLLRGIKIISAAIGLTKSRTLKKIGKKISKQVVAFSDTTVWMSNCKVCLGMPIFHTISMTSQTVIIQNPFPTCHKMQIPTIMRWIETNDGLNEYLRSFQTGPSQVDLVSIKKYFNWLSIMFIKIVKY